MQKKFDWASCQDVNPLTPVTSRDALLRSGGDNYWVDPNNCLHLKLTDPGHPWKYTDGFTRDGMYIEEEVSPTHLNYTVCCCDLQSCHNLMPALSLAPAVPQPVASCLLLAVS